MNTKTQLTQYAAAEEAARQAREVLLKRLDANATVIRNVWRKRFQGETMPDVVAWTTVYRKPEAVIRFTGDEKAPVSIEYKGKTYRITSELFYGSTWDIAKVTRQIGDYQRWIEWTAEQKKLNIRVRNADRALAQRTEEIERRAEREIKELQREHEREVEKDTLLLALRERQIGNMKARFESKS